MIYLQAVQEIIEVFVAHILVIGSKRMNSLRHSVVQYAPIYQSKQDHFAVRCQMLVQEVQCIHNIAIELLGCCHVAHARVRIANI